MDPAPRFDLWVLSSTVRMSTDEYMQVLHSGVLWSNVLTSIDVYGRVLYSGVALDIYVFDQNWSILKVEKR